MSQLSIEGVSKTFDGGLSPVLDEVNLTAEQGEILVLLGRSGSGKTTLLRTINRLTAFDRGRITVAERDIASVPATELRRSIGYVMQGAALFPHWSVAQNIGVVPELLEWPAEKIQTRVDELLRLMQLDPAEYHNRLPSELSGGERQRIGVARALAARPGLLLLDEPFGALDPLTRDQLQTDFARLQRELGFTCVLVTHDMTEALLLADRIAVLLGGRIVQLDTPAAILEQPANRYVEELLETPKRQAARLKGLLDG